MYTSRHREPQIKTRSGCGYGDVATGSTCKAARQGKP